jgi:hypothetical protein
VLFLADQLVLQCKRGDCGIGTPVIDALCGQNANRQSEHERGDENDCVYGHHGSPLRLLAPFSLHGSVFNRRL